MFFSNFNNKGISPVVAMALLLVVAVVSVVGFQGWFTNFSSKIFVDVEKDSSSDSLASIETLVGNNLYIKSSDNLSVNSISVSGTECDFNGDISGLQPVNLSNCLENVSGSVEILINTNKGLLTKFIYVDSEISVSGQVGNVVSSLGIYNSDFGRWIGGNNDYFVNDILVDSSNNIYVVGKSDGASIDDGISSITGTFSGGEEGFIFKFDSSGNYLWGQWIGGTYDDLIKTIDIDSSNNIYVGGYAQSDVTDDLLGSINGTYSGGRTEGLVMKFSPSGSYLWGQWIGGSAIDQVRDILVDLSGNIFVVGSAFSQSITDDGFSTLDGTVPLGNYNKGFLIKFDSSGTHQFGKWISGSTTNSMRVNSIDLDSNGDIYLGGQSTFSDLTTNLGSFQGTYSGNDEGYFLKLNSTGDFLWGQWLGTSSLDTVSGVLVDSNDNVFVLGNSGADITDDSLGSKKGTYSSTFSGGFLFKFDSSGTYLNGHLFGGVLTDIRSGLIDSNDNVFVVGTLITDNPSSIPFAINGTFTGASEGFIFKFNSSLDYLTGQWIGGNTIADVGSYSGQETDTINSVAIDSSNNIYLGGFSGTNVTDDNLNNMYGNYSGQYESYFLKFEFN